VVGPLERKFAQMQKRVNLLLHLCKLECHEMVFLAAYSRSSVNILFVDAVFLQLAVDRCHVHAGFGSGFFDITAMLTQ